MQSLNLPDLLSSHLLNGGNKEELRETDSGLAERCESFLPAVTGALGEL